MTQMIQMTAAQAAQVRDTAQKTSMLIPVPLPDGTFYVGAHVAGAPEFADRAALLTSFPQVDFVTMMSASAPAVVSAIVASGGSIVEPTPVVSGAIVTSGSTSP